MGDGGGDVLRGGVEMGDMGAAGVPALGPTTPAGDDAQPMEVTSLRERLPTVLLLYVVPIVLTIPTVALPDRLYNGDTDRDAMILIFKLPCVLFAMGALYAYALPYLTARTHWWGTAPLFVLGAWPTVVALRYAHGELMLVYQIPLAMLVGTVLSTWGLKVHYARLGAPVMDAKLVRRAVSLVVLFGQLAFSVSFGLLFLSAPTYLIVILCALYPFGIAVVKGVLLQLLSKEETRMPYTIEFLSHTFAAVPYRFAVFPELSSVGALVFIVLVELTYKAVVYAGIIRWHYGWKERFEAWRARGKESGDPVAVDRPPRTLERGAANESSARFPLKLRTRALDRTTVAHYLSAKFYAQQILDSCSVVAMLVLLAIARADYREGYFGAVDDKSDSKWESLVIYYVVALVFELAVLYSFPYLIAWHSQATFKPAECGFALLRKNLGLKIIVLTVVYQLLFFVIPEQDAADPLF